MDTQRPIATYLGGWVAAALVAAAITAVRFEVPSFDPWLAVRIVALITLAELIVIHVSLERAGAAFTLSEAGIVGGLLLVDPAYVVIGTAVATVLAHLPRHLSADKVVFNVSQVVVCTAAAGLTMSVVPAVGPVIGERPLLAAVAAMLVYASINTLAFRGLVGRIAGPDGRLAFDAQTPLSLASLFGTVAVGIVAAHLWVTQPLLIVLLLAPLLAIQIAARSSLRAEQLVTTLRAERDRLEQVVLGASDGILLLDGRGRVQIWSPALERLTGISAAQADGRPIDELLTDGLRTADDVVRDRWVMDRAADRRTRIDATWRTPDGQDRDVQEDHTLVFDDRGRCSGDVVLVRDVSRERTLERLRSDFVARVSHELRTPLTPIRGYVHLLLQRSDRMTDAQRTDALHHVLDRTDRLADLIEDLLLVTQLERGQLDGIVDPRPIDAAAVVRQAVEASRDPDAPGTVRLEVDPVLPAALADPKRLRQILVVLLDNAVRYGEPDQPVSVVLDAEGERVRLRVIDQGPGIPAGEQERIFERFQRLEDPLTMRTSGVGVGLFIVRELSLAMDGSVDLTPNPNGGSIFTVRLPAARPPAGEEPPPEPTGSEA